MNCNKYLTVFSEDYLSQLGVQGRKELRAKAAQDRDLYALLDIDIYRFLHGGNALYVDLLPELFYLFGKAKDIERLQNLLEAYSFTLMMLPQECINRAKIMLNLGVKFPSYTEEELQYLEMIWCESNSYEWMNIIMYDEDCLPRKLRRFDENSLNVVHTNFSEGFLLKIYDLFEQNEEEQDVPYCYDRKINDIRRIRYEKLGRGEYVIENDKVYKDIHVYLENQYGQECADFFANELCFRSLMTVEEFKTSTFCSLKPYQVIRVAENFFNNEHDVVAFKKWFASDFLYKCNHPPKGWR